MKRASLYSSSRVRPENAAPVAGPPKIALKTRFKESFRRYRVPLAAATPGLVALAVVLFQSTYAPAPQNLTQEDIDAAVVRSFESVPLPSAATKAYESVRGSIVRVRSFMNGPDGGEIEGGVGTGVVILDTGVILTNIHVVAGAKRISVTFETGMESDAHVTGTRPEDDLAVLQAAAIPDDLQAATLQSTSGLSPGDHVTAVGFPFGIGPSVSSGVVSGLRREHRSPEGK
jgi:S1-C subfamily serine protease